MRFSGLHGEDAALADEIGVHGPRDLPVQLHAPAQVSDAPNRHVHSLVLLLLATVHVQDRELHSDALLLHIRLPALMVHGFSLEPPLAGARRDAHGQRLLKGPQGVLQPVLRHLVRRPVQHLQAACPRDDRVVGRLAVGGLVLQQQLQM
eukprot:CAMPEP_0195086648 /NCGR_PEP_ID=MMETSP0448-20130528/26732_1 /TAXON_ID=66468 /ORGANISM="Heterocapsa triquestra, Strain CCMP 448" /LENGTH=148 /DNA_ID=CAMNT_0040120149 /DNA_START=102 /DNA_END=548 /DNA_ORIENTATION=+